MAHVFACLHYGRYYTVLKKYGPTPYKCLRTTSSSSNIPQPEATGHNANAFGLESPSEATLRYWFEKFPYGDFNLEGKSVPGGRMSLDDKVLRAAVG